MKKKKFFSFSFYFWIAFALLMVTLFFINRAIIGKAITKIKDSPSFSTPEIINDGVKETLKSSLQDERPNFKDEKDLNVVNNTNTEINPPIDDIKESDAKSSIMEDNLPSEDASTHPTQSRLTDQKTEHPSTTEKTYQTKPSMQVTKNEMRNVDVYFASVNDNGVVTREKCVRSIERSLSPMVDSLNALLEGPTKEEAKHGIRSFIPADTRLLSASIKEETALINLSEDFQFNRYGVEGYNIQLQQIVFTVCSFPTVKSVQFLIEGQKRDFIGSEGVWIGSPLTVNSF